jgi:DNA-binding CsgD family transcriptional regulator/PAS domain-containing protein
MPRGPELESLIGQAYDCVLDPEGWGALLDACARFAGGDTAVVYVKPRASAAGSLLTSRDFDLSYNVSRYLSYYEQRSPLIEFYARQPEGGARALGDYAFSAAYRETEFFQDWIRPQGFADMLGSHLVRRPQLSAWMSIRRSEQRGLYSTAEIHAAGRLLPHLGRAIKLRFRLEMERRIADDLRDSLELVDFGVVIVDVSGKVLAANRAADTILKAADGLKSHAGRLACDRPEDSSALATAICAVAEPSRHRKPAPVDLSIPRKAAHRPLTAHVVPIPTSSVWKGFAPPSGVAAVFVIDPLVRCTNADSLAEAYDLTAAECRVLREIVQGSGLVDTARTLRVAVPTARTHLQHIFEKTNVNSQAELVRLVMNSSLQLSVPGRDRGPRKKNP